MHRRAKRSSRSQRRCFPTPPHPEDPEQVYISAEGIHLYQPDTGFVLYAINSGSRNSGDTHNFRGKLAFRGWSYNYGAQFQLSLCQGKTRIRSNKGGYLVAVMGLADCLEGECLDHAMRSACETCE
ncbi:uncharacterized protein BO72DRAFT_501154 [Aspergillus fijiensis CBS 313.89]|uniref:Uncharacterized protein n=1 Tax=Aspergillus fijiensis CBS 313.89 TaxID=1448319 RepID=A0A8G1REA8_9EURO|nr:uncharacterized protein BO72DRAFT_501154 [Aspergillus fijiensis CBS 313.89]RAK72232.1 hypothetical protein BO72DRAFT_501154 [Aspergillus fijiensis CBS 313.89]